MKSCQSSRERRQDRLEKRLMGISSNELVCDRKKGREENHEGELCSGRFMKAELWRGARPSYVISRQGGPPGGLSWGTCSACTSPTGNHVTLTSRNVYFAMEKAFDVTKMG